MVRRRFPGWLLALALLVICVRPAPGAPVNAEAPVDFEALAGDLGRAEAWYRVNGDTLSPPAAAQAPLDSPLMPLTAQTLITPVLTPTVYLPMVINHFPLPVERRAIWITRYDWTSLGVAAQPQKIDELVANVAEAGFNTIFFQVRAAGDAYYTPGLEPWASRLSAGTVTETLGVDPGWDPLARMLDVAHAAGVEVHAYVNVYPAWLPSPSEAYGPLAPPATAPPQMFDRFTYGSTYLEHPGEYGLGMDWRHHDMEDPMLLTWGAYLWASPGVDQVQSYIAGVVRDIVTRYAVDGVHLDLVRYAGLMYSYDPDSNAAAGDVRTLTRNQWQRDRVTALVQQVYSETQALRQEAWVSAAVWPYYKNDLGLQTSSGYDDYFQDSKGWLAAGIVDAIAPMLYGTGSSIPDDLANWRILAEDFVASSAAGHVYPGIAGYYDDFDAIAQRIEIARELGAPGHALFSYATLDSRGYWDDLAAGPYRIPALVPLRMH
ncbi:MAG: family 10 glycosylhydrolase [Anaerolineae bacterium]|nr:family 10 glycosylhydrolase [Anaerolineae bacterium]